MKARLIFGAALFSSIVCAQVPYVTPLSITRFDGATATLSWTNQICANVPVYEVLRSMVVTGNWQHFFFVTNAQSTTLTNSLGTNGGAVFHKLDWIGDSPMVFSYEFDEGNGFGPCITGELRVSFRTPGTWQFADDGFCFDEIHVTGSGTLRPRSLSWASVALPHMAQFDLTSPPDNQFLEASLQSSVTGGQCVYTGMVGTVYQNGFVGATPIGTFKARRTQ
jgi:hypothetical protein